MAGEGDHGTIHFTRRQRRLMGWYRPSHKARLGRAVLRMGREGPLMGRGANAQCPAPSELSAEGFLKAAFELLACGFYVVAIQRPIDQLNPVCGGRMCLIEMAEE